MDTSNTENKIDNFYKWVLNFLENMLYNLLYYYSFIELKCIKMCRLITNMFESEMISSAYLVFNDNNEQIFDDWSSTKLCNHPDKDRLFIVYTENRSKVCYYGARLLMEEYKHSNIRWLSLTLDIKGTIYNIELWNNHYINGYNYYIVNNKIDYRFFRYFLKHVLNVNVDDFSTYEGTLLDHNVNFVSFNEKSTITILENDYTIEHATDDKDDNNDDDDDNNETIEELQRKLSDEYVNLDDK